MALVERLAILIDANSQGATREFRKLSAEAKSADTNLTKTQKASSAVTAGIKTMGIVAGGSVVAGLAKMADQSIDAASNLEEVRQKAEQIFGGSFGRIESFAEGAADSLGLSTRAALDFTASFGNLFSSAGIDEANSARLSESLATLAGDIASFNNITVDEAAQKLLAGLSGEAEPLRRVGVFLSEAKVKAEAYESGIADVGSTLNDAQKFQARYNIIMRETANAQGDFARTSESLANSQRRLNAITENAQAKIGEDLAPRKAEALTFLSDLISSTSEVEDKFAETTGKGLGITFAESLAPVQALNLVKDFQALLRGTGDAAESSAPPVDDFAAATQGTLDIIDRGKAKVFEMGGEFAYAGDEAEDASAAIQVLTDALDKMRSPVLDVRDAQRNLAEALDAATDAIDENGRTLDINTEKGRANQEALDGIAESAFDALNAYAENGASAKQLTDRTENLRAKLIEAAERFGMTKKEARQYADQLGLIPGDITTNVRLAGIDSAIEQAKRLKDLTTGLSVSQLTSVVRQDRAMVNRRASGGPVGDGLYLVGEQGPELLDLRGGTGRVTSNAQTRPMLSNNNSRNFTVNGNVTVVTPDPSRTWDVLNDLAVA